MNPLIANIHGGIWLGNIRAATDDTLLKKHKITGSLSVCQLQYMTAISELFVCPLRDDERNKPETLLAAVLLLGELLTRHEHVLLHCHHGGSRSVAVLMLWLYRNGHARNMDEARDYIQQRYPLKLSARQPRPGLRDLLQRAEGMRINDLRT